VHGAHDSSSFILLHEHSKGFQIIYTNCPGNVFQGNVLSGKVIVWERSCPGNVLSGKRLSGKVIVRETSVTPGRWVLSLRSSGVCHRLRLYESL